jgi:hypothetical protein
VRAAGRAKRCDAALHGSKIAVFEPFGQRCSDRVQVHISRTRQQRGFVVNAHGTVVLRSRPDVVKTWDDTEVARRWLMLCPLRTRPDGSPEEPSVCELNSIRHDSHKLQEIRRRLSDFSWWMRLLCQRIAQRANAQDQEQGKFWQAR